MTDETATVSAGRDGQGQPDTRFEYQTVARLAPPDCGEAVLFYRRTAKPSSSPPLIRKRDLGEVALHGMMAAAALTRPPRTWAGFCHRVTRLRYPRLARGLEPFREGLCAVLGDLPDAEVERHFEQWWDAQHRRRMMLVREYLSAGPVEFSVTGRQHLDDAARLGRGMILWAAPFTFQAIAGKRGLADAGLRAYQVSSRHHGFWDTYTRFGDRFLNRPLARAEDRYLAGRLAFERDDAGMLVRRILRTLKSGVAVILTNNLYAGRSFVELPFGRAGHISMPTTPIALALRGRVPILACATIERQPFSHYEIRISRDLAAEEHGAGGAGTAGDDDPALARVALKARDALLAAVLEAPDQFLSWPPLARSVLNDAA